MEEAPPQMFPGPRHSGLPVLMDAVRPAQELELPENNASLTVAEDRVLFSSF